MCLETFVLLPNVFLHISHSNEPAVPCLSVKCLRSKWPEVNRTPQFLHLKQKHEESEFFLHKIGTNCVLTGIRPDSNGREYDLECIMRVFGVGSI